MNHRTRSLIAAPILGLLLVGVVTVTALARRPVDAGASQPVPSNPGLAAAAASATTAPTTTAPTTTSTSAPVETTTTPPAPPPTTAPPATGFDALTPAQLAAFRAFVSPTTTAAPRPRPVVVVPVTEPPPPPPPAPVEVVESPPPPEEVPPPPAPEPPAVAPPAEPPPPGASPLESLNESDRAFLLCVRWRESRDDYTAVNRWSGAGGAYQFLQSTWNNTAAYAGWYHLIGVHPSQASPIDQDNMAIVLLGWYGRSPWGGYCY